MPSANARRTGWIVLAACAPSLLTLALVAGFWKAGPGDFTTLWNDETVYWNEAAVFRRAGFNGGYITVNEKPAQASFSRFGPHGPAFAVLYGFLGRLTGWRSYSPYLIHLFLIPLCAGSWLWVTRHHPHRWAAALLVAGFWPLLYYLPSSMQDPLHFGIACLFAALVESRLTPAWRVALGTILMVVACLTRPTWALAIPALLWGREPGWWRRVAAVSALRARLRGGLRGRHEDGCTVSAHLVDHGGRRQPGARRRRAAARGRQGRCRLRRTAPRTGPSRCCASRSWADWWQAPCSGAASRRIAGASSSPPS